MAKRTVPQPIFDYADGAAWDEVTARRNRAAFEDVTLHPKALTDVSQVDLRTTVLGGEIALPIIGRADRADRAPAPGGRDGGRARRPRRGDDHHALDDGLVHARGGRRGLARAGAGSSSTCMTDRGLVDSLLERARGQRLRGARC